MTNPQISVILPVFNCEKYVKLAIESILHQTFTDFEFIIIDDGSTDNSASIIEQIRDPRICFYKQANAGMAATLNKGISLAKGKFIARQDADDLSLPMRFEKQIDFLNNNQHIALVGTQATIISEDGTKTDSFHRHEPENNKLKAMLYFDNPFVHSSVIFRKEVLERTGPYNTSLHPLLQDFDLWFRISQISGVSNLNEVLQEYRKLPTGISNQSHDFSELVAMQCYQHLQRLVDDSNELKSFAFFYHKCFNRAEHMTAEKAIQAMKKVQQTFCINNNLSAEKEPMLFSILNEQLKRSSLDFSVYKNKDNPLLKFFSKIRRKLLWPAG